MDTSTQSINRILAGVCGVAFAAPFLFFAWYTVRLAYVNLTMPADERAARMSSGMWIGAVTFPVAAVVCGLISWYFVKRAVRGFDKDEK